MGEVDQPHDAENQPDAERGERVQAAERERVDGVLDQSGHDGPSDEESATEAVAGPPCGEPASAR